MPNAVTAAGKRTLKSNHSRLVGKDACMKVWIYGRDEREICAMFAYCVGNSDTIIGLSVQKSVMSFFPQGGLTQPMQAAMRGELDRLLLSDIALLGDEAEQICEMKKAFASYQVSIKSASNSDSSSS